VEIELWRHETLLPPEPGNLNSGADEREVEGFIQAAVEVIFGDELFEREIEHWGEVADLGAHHDSKPP
jgi:hypothetical protein